MKKQMFLALLLALVLALTSSCSLIVKDPEVDKQTVVLEVNGKAFTKGEVQQLVSDELAYQEYIYTYQYGMTLDTSDPELIAYAQDAAIESLTQQAVLERKLAVDGYLELSEEELVKAREDADAVYDSYVNGVIATDFADSGLTEEEQYAAAEALMAEMGGYPTREELFESQKLSVASEKLYQEIVKDVTLTEEEIQAEYTSRVDTAKADYEADPQYFDMDVSDGATIYYYPAGYRYVKHILISMTVEDQEKLEELDNQILLKQQELSTVQAGLDTLGDDPSQDNESEALSRQELLAEHQRVSDELLALQNERSSAEEAAFAVLQPTVDEVQAKLAEGVSFDELIVQYGEDPGMESEPAKSLGYLVGYNSTNWVESFRDGAMALAQVGDVSEPVRSDYGLHIIQYTSDAPEGAVALEDVRDALELDLLYLKQDETYQSAVATWVNDADVKVYKNRLKD